MFKNFVCLIMMIMAVNAMSADMIGMVASKGWFLKDKILVVAFDDPNISGITCYTTQHKRAMSFSDGSSVSLACRQTGKIDIGRAGNASNVFATSKGFLKTTVVDRFIDKKRNTVVYLTYTKGDGKNNSHSISTVVIRPW